MSCEIEEDQLLLIDVPDVSVLAGRYQNAAIAWYLDSRKQFITFEFQGKDVALVSLFYVVIRLHERIKTGKAIAVASVMTLVTFLLPTYILPLFIEKVEEWLAAKNLGETTRVVIAYIIGLAGGLLFIFVEKEIIETFIL